MGVHVEEADAEDHAEEVDGDDAGDSEESAGADAAGEVDVEVFGGEEAQTAGTARAVEAAGSSLGSHWGCRWMDLACMRSHSAGAEEGWHAGAAGGPDSSSRGGRGFSRTVSKHPAAGGYHDGGQTGHRWKLVVRPMARG